MSCTMVDMVGGGACPEAADNESRANPYRAHPLTREVAPSSYPNRYQPPDDQTLHLGVFERMGCDVRDITHTCSSMVCCLEYEAFNHSPPC